MSFKINAFVCLCVVLFSLDSFGQKTFAPKLEPQNFSSFSQPQKIVEAMGVRTNGFGSSVAIDGTTAIVGANLDDENGRADQGSAYVFVRNAGTWTLQARLVAADGAVGDLFGTSVAIAGETIIVGAVKGDGAAADSGAGYVFTRNGSTWTQQAKLTANDGAANDNFGISAAINGNSVVIGANLDDVGTGSQSFDQGSAYVFVRSGTTWTQQARLIDPNGFSSINFGIAAAINGDSIAVGANGFNGFAYLFTRTGAIWTLQSRFQPNDIATQDNFGGAIGINGDAIVVGSASANTTTPDVNQGAVYVFQRVSLTNTVAQIQKITVADGAANDFFGTSLGFDGSSIIVGAIGDDVGSNQDQGSAYVFVKNTAMMWTLQKQFIIPSGAEGDQFSNSVAISGSLAIGGAALRDVDGRADQGAAYAFARNADNSWAQPDELGVSDPLTNAYFGISTDLEGTTAIVGAPYETIGGKTFQGAVYIYTKTGMTWGKQAKLLAGDGAAGDSFGFRVAISGDTIVVGATSKDKDAANPDQGAVYVFTRTGATWTQQAKLTAMDGATYDYFGGSVAIKGNTIIVGAANADINGASDKGAAYVFTRSGGVWTQQSKLTADDGEVEDNFGWSVTTDGTTTIIGAIGDDTGGNNGQGSVYVFTNSGGTWTQTQKLTMNDPQSATAFGATVSLDGDTFAVGAFFTYVGSNSTQGAAYVFTRTAGIWSQQAKLLASDGGDGDYFGSSVSLSGDNLLVSAEYDDVGANINQGSVYVFERAGTSWTQRQKIVASDGAAYNSFGNQVAIDGANIVIGAPTADVINPKPEKLYESKIGNEIVAASGSQGAAYFYTAFAPTAAEATLGGRITNLAGRPLRNVRVVLSGDGLSQPRYALTNPFGYYRFANLPVGETYVVTAAGKRWFFDEPTQIISLFGDQNAIDFVGR